MAIIFAALSATFAFYLVMISPEDTARDSSRSDGKKAKSMISTAAIAAAVTFGCDLLLQRIDLYYFQPSLSGSFFGYFWPVLFALAPAIGWGCLFANFSLKSISASILAVLILIGWPIGQSMWYGFGPDNSRAFASLPHVRWAGANETIPPTDEQHLITVTPDMAKLKAQTVLSSKGNYSTRYAVGNLTLQAIRGHRYYAAPLVPTNTGDTFWTPLFGGRTESPGYVLVDAEDKEAQPQLRDGFHITLFEGMHFGMNLNRFVYQAGFDKGDLDNATFEVDDNFQPHWTITYVTPAFGNIVGKKISKVLVVDVATASPVVHAYNQGDKAISWVDRVVSDDLVKTYARDWGTFGQPYSNSSFGAWLQVKLGFSKQDTMVPDEDTEGLMLSYTKDGHCIWVVPMTSKNSTDETVIGVLVFDTDQNQATYYPGLRGFNVSSSAAQTMLSAKDNGLQKYDVSTIELYNIYGHLTWVAVYTRSQTIGATFGAIGFMDAHSQSAADVSSGTDLQSALTDYATRLAQGGNGMQLNQANQTVALVGKIWRIAPNGTTWRFQLVGDGKHYFDVNPQTYLGTPLLRDGDQVQGSYVDSHQSLEVVHTLGLVGKGAAD